MPSGRMRFSRTFFLLPATRNFLSTLIATLRMRLSPSVPRSNYVPGLRKISPGLAAPAGPAPRVGRAGRGIRISWRRGRRRCWRLPRDLSSENPKIRQHVRSPATAPPTPCRPATSASGKRRQDICQRLTDSVNREVTRNGTTYTMQTGNIGPHPIEDVRTIASDAGSEVVSGRGTTRNNCAIGTFVFSRHSHQRQVITPRE
jgi:hypothetical protein